MKKAPTLQADRSLFCFSIGLGLLPGLRPRFPEIGARQRYVEDIDFAVAVVAASLVLVLAFATGAALAQGREVGVGEEFYSLNLDAELARLDAMFQGWEPSRQKGWFLAASRMLGKKHDSLNGRSVSAEKLEDEFDIAIENGATVYIDRKTGQGYIKTPTGELIPISGGAI